MARKARSNITVLYNGTNITQYCNKADLEAAIEQLEVTNLASTGKETISDDTEWKISVEGMWEVALDAVLGPDAVTPGNKRNASITLAGASQSVTYGWTANAEIENYKLNGAVGDFITWSGALALSGAPTRTVA